jgi:hypothetical protein
VGQFSPALLFRANEQGVWFDPDPTTTFTDTAGTTPADVGDPVALMLDKSGNDHHATQPTAAARPILARVPASGRRNLLTRTEEFDNAAWVKSNATVTANATTAPNGTTTADKLVGTGNNPFVRLDGFTNTSAQVISVYAKAAELNWLRLTNDSATSSAAWFDLSSGAVGTVSGTGNPSASVESVGDGWYRCSMAVEVFVTESLTDVVIACTNADNTTTGYTGDGTSGIFIWGAQLEEVAP